jgi:hypothetical protein
LKAHLNVTLRTIVPIRNGEIERLLAELRQTLQ